MKSTIKKMNIKKNSNNKKITKKNKKQNNNDNILKTKKKHNRSKKNIKNKKNESKFKLSSKTLKNSKNKKYKKNKKGKQNKKHTKKKILYGGMIPIEGQQFISPSGQIVEYTGISESYSDRDYYYVTNINTNVKFPVLLRDLTFVFMFVT